MAKIPDITIDMDRRCTKCGVLGACGNGLCLPCNTARLKRMPAGLVKDIIETAKGGRMAKVLGAKKEGEKSGGVTLKDKALVAAQAQLSGLLAEDWDDIWRDMEKSQEIHAQAQAGEEKPKPFVFSVSAKVSLGAAQGDWDIDSEIAWSLKRKDLSESVTVSNQPTLFDQKE